MSRDEPLHSTVPSLTPAERERLALLAEEAAEVVQIVMKILRHGYESYHPDDPSVTNNRLLEQELGDLMAAVQLMESRKDIDTDAVFQAKKRKMRTADRYLHHNTFADFFT